MDELQEEEILVLESIYEGDASFTKVNKTVYQYKYSEFGENKNFVLEIKWGPNYPDEAPEVNLDVFYNKHICAAVKDAIKKGVLEQAEMFLGTSMTFSLIEWLKDNSEPYLALQTTSDVKTNISTAVENLNLNDNTNTDTSKITKKKETLTKNQKRRMWDKQNAMGEKERGYDWVDIIKHLSQGGSQSQSS